jgi:hypothetical protein
MKRALFVVLLLSTVAAHAATVDNDDSCDISVLPAATLLLPYFEVDLENPAGETTLFTVTNVTNLDQIAHVTLWTDYGYLVIDFNLYLTGYDVQAINLYDIIARGVIAPDAGTGTAVTKRGRFSDRNTALNLTACDRLPGVLDDNYITRMQQAFTLGKVPQLGTAAGCNNIGGVHHRAIGYATVDVVGSCKTSNATDPAYWTEVIRYDNVLIGDYQQLNHRQSSSQAGPMVHIRAVPEGGTPASRRTGIKYDAGFPRTFYSRFQASDSPRLDGRQPLPSTFAARWISGGAGRFATSLKIWREGKGNSATCVSAASGADLRAIELVTFDEEGSGTTTSSRRARLPVTSSTPITDAKVFPQPASGATAGWLYLNLDESLGDRHASQGWVISSMRAAGGLSTDIEAMAFGNGCSAPAFPTAASIADGEPIAPAPDENPGGVTATINNDDSCDIALLPAATLLLPYFEVDLDDPLGETTLFTVTNVSPGDQIARVTLWTDYAYPVITFNVYLTGYDVQAINLYDLLARGVIASSDGTGTRVTARGDDSTRNAGIDLSACRNLRGTLDPVQITRMRHAFTLGSVPAFGYRSACNTVGNVHDNATGYATIDVVRSCSNNIPTDYGYFTEDLAYDNVLIGDYQQVNSIQASAQGSTMVHIRAIPDGGTSITPSPFQRTFYSRYQGGAILDRRQPLPATFAARWIEGGPGSFQTSYKIWREGETDLGGTICHAWQRNITFLTEVVRFDEAENAVGDIQPRCYVTCLTLDFMLPPTSLTSVTDRNIFPPLPNAATSGWMYINLDGGESGDSVSSSSWVVVSIRAQGRFSVDMDAAALGNGCSLEIPQSEITVGATVLGPAPNKP